jgi:uncharacterized protein (TIGR02246 family)
MTRSNANEAEIRALIEVQVKAHRDKDAKAVLASFAPDSVTFDLAPPLRHPGAGPRTEKDLAEWFKTWQGPVGVEPRDFKIVADDSLAFCHGLIRITGTKTGGERADLWARQTVCLEKINGAWTIMHDHTSVPFYMDGSYKAAIDLEP